MSLIYLKIIKKILWINKQLLTKIIRKVSIFKTFQVQKIGFKSIEVKDNFINKK